MDDVKELTIVKKINDKKKKEIIKNIGKTLTIVVFVIASIVVANKHEHWSDEAQSFLLARDNSLFELYGYMKYEGTPPLWVTVLKMFICLGGTYETLFILPIIFSIIGLIIFEFKIKAPWYIKVLLPFTYFVFYQYTIVARSYCMVFPMLMFVALIYEKRFEKPILYAIILFFLMNISLHTLIISGSLYLIFLIDMFKNKKYKEKRIIVACILIFMELFLAMLCTIPASDCAYVPNSGENLPHVILEATMGSNSHELFELIMAIIIIEILVVTLKKNQIINFFILMVPVVAVLMFITFQGWHIGIVWLILFTSLIINNSINKNIVIKIFVVIICLTQIYWTISSVNYDFNNNYSASKNIAEFLKENNYEEKKIYGLGYSITAILPYFEQNIFENQNTDKSFWFWRENKGYMTGQEILDNEADIYIISKFYVWQYYQIMNELYNRGYTRLEFVGHTYIKTDIYESEGYYLYTKNPEILEKYGY